MDVRGLITRALFLMLTAVISIHASPAGAQRLKDRVVEHTLDNGMKLILMERRAAPVVSAVIRYKVGSVDEEEGKTGLAHLYEHLAFRGTEIIGTRDYGREKRIRARIDSVTSAREEAADACKVDEGLLETLDQSLESLKGDLGEILIEEELDRIYNLNGAVGLDASTTADLTTFMVDLPANRLPLWAILESDRMAHSVPRDFEVERRIVAEERRGRVDDDPEASLYQAYLETAFEVHPYGRPVSGVEQDLVSVSPADARAFYETHYSPRNAVAAIVGALDVEEVIALAETTFGRISGQAFSHSSVPKEPAQKRLRRVVLERDAEPALFLGFHKPGIASPDDRLFEILIDILTRGETSRLHSSLFIVQRIAMDASSWIGPGDRYPNLLTIAMRPISPHTSEDVETGIWRELNRLKQEPASDEELLRSKNRLAADFLRGLQNNRGLADALTYYEAVLGDWRYLEDRLELIESVTAQDLLECARQYLIPENCTVAVLKSTRRGSED